MMNVHGFGQRLFGQLLKLQTIRFGLLKELGGNPWK